MNFSLEHECEFFTDAAHRTWDQLYHTVWPAWQSAEATRVKQRKISRRSLPWAKSMGSKWQQTQKHWTRWGGAHGLID